jgi:hypothetical protein
MRRFLVLAVAFTIGAVAWILLDADPEGRQELVDRIANAFNGTEEAPPPNWGDVATKVGEFTDEERALREALNPALAGAPQPASVGE